MLNGDGGFLRRLGLITAMLTGMAGLVAAPPAAAARPDVCAKQVAAVHKAKSGPRKAAARRRLEQCRSEHAVSIAPAKPLASEAVTVTIHPRWPLRKGYLYGVTVIDPGGPGAQFVRFASKVTRSLTVQFSPADSLEEPGAPTAGAEWQAGEADVEVVEGTRHQLRELPIPQTATRGVAFLNFAFYRTP